eukprot:755275_1
MVPPILKFITPILLITTIKSYFDTTDPTTIFWFRIIFGIGHTIVISSLLYIYFAIPNHPDSQRKIRVTQKELEPGSPLDNIIGTTTEAKDDNKIIKMNQMEYDKYVWQKKFKQSCIAIVLIPILHYFFGIVVPLVMSVLLSIQGLIDDPLFRLYVRKHTSDRNKALVRPFKFSNPMDSFKKMQEAWMPEEEKEKEETNVIGSNGKSGTKTAKKGGNSKRRKKPRKM